ncbi:MULTISPECIES: hypothetical protein [Deinococcus]|uniref:Uncharacterized protein n=1 Tax=Deinococcus cavernae TaxID=2320857 RepID=A0A418V273_9DEIO|nr:MULTISPECIES: hypothetical protein [Deinococcus]RJF70030.1 hypothetical protein D3875_20270 [Deinococcus cavernae]RJF72742.1 hypothetical protein D3875_15530 [Deinococcus cavernae]
MQGHYMMYHNPERMEEDCEEAQMYERVATAKQGIANQLAAENGIIWCVGRKWDDDAFYLYQRIDGAYPEPGDAEFPVHLVGTPLFEEGEMVDISEKPYFKDVFKLLRFGVQPIDSQAVIDGFQDEFVKLVRARRKP